MCMCACLCVPYFRQLDDTESLPPDKFSVWGGRSLSATKQWGAAHDRLLLQVRLRNPSSAPWPAATAPVARLPTGRRL